MAKPRVSFKTVGCRLNQAETALMAAQFMQAGYEVVAPGDHAEVAIIHGCTLPQAAERKTVQYARAARSRNTPCVVIAGCPAQLDPAGMLADSGANIVAGQADKYRLVELIGMENRAGTGKKNGEPFPPSHTPRHNHTRALVKVQDGCNFRCSYCIVPDARGAPASLPATEIVEEITRLADTGFKEVVLTGANLGCYKDGNNDLLRMIGKIEQIPGIRRIRLSSIEPGTCEKALIDLMANSDKLCRFLHVPLQSGDDRILHAMRRRYSAAQYIAFVEYAAGRLGPFGLGTDIITGFPGEDDVAFESTVKLVESLPFSNLHVFPYSRRPGTPASEMDGQVKNSTRTSRARLLAELGTAKRAVFARQFLGKEVTVLIEGRPSGTEGSGWTSEYIEATVHGASLTRNQLVKFVPHKLTGARLGGECTNHAG